MRNSIVICTTNYLDKIKEADPAILSRFNHIVELPHIEVDEANDFVRKYSKEIYGNEISFDDLKIDSINLNMRFISNEINKYFNSH